jgi:hypothetical protein
MMTVPAFFKACLTGCCLLALLQFSSCDDGSEEVNNNPGTPSTVDCSSVAATYTDANAIIQSSCATTVTCHGSGSSRGPGELITYEQIFHAKNTIRTSVRSGSMPQNGSLSAAEKATIICWIDNGAPQN